jgi:hypothetical protein
MQTYSTEEVNRVIQRALHLKRRIGISQAELLEIGKDLGLDSQMIEAAIAEERSALSREKAEKEWRQSRKFGFHWHLWSYIVTNGVLLLVNIFTSGPWWVQWPVIGWGIGLAFHFQSVYFPTARQVKEGVRRYLGPEKQWI